MFEGESIWHWLGIRMVLEGHSKGIRREVDGCSIRDGRAFGWHLYGMNRVFEGQREGTRRMLQ